MNKILISHASSIIISPFVLSFFIALCWGVYSNDFNTMSGIPFIAFEAYIIYFLSSILIIPTIYYFRNSIYISCIFCILINGIISFALDKIFFQPSKVTFLYFFFGILAGLIYFATFLIFNKLILNKFSFIDEN